MISSKNIIAIKIKKEDLNKLDISKNHLEDVLYYAGILDDKGYEYDLEYNYLKRVSMIIKNNNAIAGFISIGEGTDYIKSIYLIDKNLLYKFDKIDVWIKDYGDIEITGELPILNDLVTK